MATTTAKAKRFSFAGFFSKKQEPSPITQQQQPPPSTDNNTATQEKKQQRRAQKTQSLYIQSFRHRFSTPSSKPTCSQYDPNEVQQSNPKEIRNTIRRSLSAVMYATPQKQREEVTTTTTQEKNNTSSSSEPGKLVPILVTEGLFDQHSGMIVSAEPETLPTEKRRVPVEYDNTLDVLDNKDGTSLVVWQGYGYVIKEEPKREDKEQEEQQQENDHASSSSLTWSFDKEVWSEYRGLIHPLHLIQEDNDDRWKALTVTELKRYYDNYGSMLLRLREACMKRQQTQYLAMEGKAKTEWLIPHA